MMDTAKEKKGYYIPLLFALVAVLGVLTLAGCKEEPRTAGDSLSEVADETRNAVDDVTDSMEEEVERHQDRTIGEKIGDEVEDAGEELQEGY